MPQKPIEETYQLSRDYELLYQLVKDGHEIVCFVDHNFSISDKEHICRDVACAVFTKNNTLEIRVRGRCYIQIDDIENKSDIQTYCGMKNVAFFVPNIPDKDSDYIDLANADYDKLYADLSNNRGIFGHELKDE